ncbi:MAG: T9SS type A sorting domain-containing protein, partial [Flexibacteraceae bacterium]
KIFSGRYSWVSASANTGGWIGYVNGFPTSYRSIAPMSAFLVRVKTGNPTVNLTFKNAHRTVAQTTALSRTATDVRPAIELTLDRGANTVGDITSIYFQNGATGFFNDAMDAQRMGNNSGMPTLYSIVNNSNYAVKGLPNLTNELIIPLGIRFHTAGTHRLSVANLQNMDGYNVYLIDYNSGTSELLTATSAISISGAANTLIDNYSLHFVPLNVTSVGAKVNAETVAVYPNPSVDGKFNVALTNVTADGVATVTVINTLGQVVAKQTANVTTGANQIAVSTSGLKVGTYSVQVRTANSTVTSNVVVR